MLLAHLGLQGVDQGPGQIHCNPHSLQGVDQGPGRLHCGSISTFGELSMKILFDKPMTQSSKNEPIYTQLMIVHVQCI